MKHIFYLLILIFLNKMIFAQEDVSLTNPGFENGNVIISAEYPETKRVLEDAGFTTRSVDMAHIRAADGSLTCCSIFY